MRTIVLAYSGGLDTSIIVPWLKEQYDARVICVAADIGQGEELEGVRAKALASGADECFVEDLREEFVEDFLWPMLRAGAIYGRKYLLGTSIARPLIARRQCEVAKALGADALDEYEDVSITFESGTPVAVDGKRLDAVSLVTRLNAIGGRHGIGRIDL